MKMDARSSVAAAADAFDVIHDAAAVVQIALVVASELPFYTDLQYTWGHHTMLLTLMMIATGHQQ